MEYINKNRTIGITGLMRVMNDAQTLAQSIDSCVNALDELIITYNDCTDESPQIIAQKKSQYPDKIQVIPYPYHVYGINLTEDEYEYAKSLPKDSPHLIANYYNNALQHVNYKYVVKIDADQIYFTEKLIKLRNDIVYGISQTIFGKMIGKYISLAFAQHTSSKKLWSKWHPRHYLQYILLPLFKESYYKYAISELRKGTAFLALSGVNAFKRDDVWYSPMGCKTGYGLWDPYNGESDTLVFEATNNTYFIPLDMENYRSNNGQYAYIERFEHEMKKALNIGLIWFHLKPMQSDCLPQLLKCHEQKDGNLIKIKDLKNMSFSQIILCKGVNTHRKYYYSFVHNYDKKIINKYLPILDRVF